MKNPFKNTSLLDQKYLSLAGISEKWKKLTSTGQKKVCYLPNFKIFNKALNKTILFLLDRKFVPISRDEEFVIKSFPFKEETVFTA